jgi:hypothetical protein
MDKVYDPNNDGAIFKNDKYRTSDKQPTHKGKVKLTREFLKELVAPVKNGADEIQLNIALWEREAKSGVPYFYTRVDVPRPQQDEPQQTPPQAKPTEPKPVDDSFDDDIPF